MLGRKRIDFVVEDCLVEIKAKSALDAVAIVQTLSYLKASGLKIALLINFGAPKIEVRRFAGPANVESGSVSHSLHPFSGSE